MGNTDAINSSMKEAIQLLACPIIYPKYCNYNPFYSSFPSIFNSLIPVFHSEQKQEIEKWWGILPDEEK